MFCGESFLEGTFYEFLFLAHKNFRLLFTHGTTEHVGTAKGESCNFLGNLHDLFLVNHDAVGFLKDSFKTRVRIVDFCRILLSFNEVRNVGHRTRTIKGVHGNKVIKAVWLKGFHPFLHAR